MNNKKIKNKKKCKKYLKSNNNKNKSTEQINKIPKNNSKIIQTIMDYKLSLH